MPNINTNLPLDQRVELFLAGSPHAVIGASSNRTKYGNKVLRVFQQNGRPVFPVNPRAEQIEGLRAYPDLASLPQKPYGISIITPPPITEQIVEQAASLGIKHIWMQPGAESARAIALAQQHDINCIAGDACILVVLRFREG